MSNIGSMAKGKTPLLASMMANSKLSNEEIESMVAEFLFGGVDTVS